MKSSYIAFLLLLTAFVLIFSSAESQTDPDEDSLMHIVNQAPDSLKAKTCNDICWSLRNFKPDLAIEFGMSAVEFSQRFNNKLQLCKAYSYLGVCQRNLGNLSDAVDYYDLGLQTSLKFGFRDQEAYSYINLGNVYLYQDNLESAEENLKKGLNLGLSLRDSSIMSYCYLNLGRVFLEQKRNKESLDYLQSALDLRFALHSSDDAISTVIKYMGDVYGQMQDFDAALEYYMRARSYKGSYSDVDMSADISNRISELYFNRRMYDSALVYAKMSLDYAKSVGTKIRIRNAYNSMAKVYHKFNNYKEASECYKNELMYYDSVFNDQLSQKIVNLKFNSEQYKKQCEIIDLNKQKEIRGIYIKMLVLFVIMGVVLVVFLIRGNIRKRKTNHQLKLQKIEIENKNIEISRRSDEISAQLEELERQKNFIEQQNNVLVRQQKQITDSIMYAKRIQNALFPGADSFKSIFSDSFVFYRPKDVVSGDFYWVLKQEDFLLFALGDCTGHGVPGAFMSMLGISALQEISRRHDVERKPEAILEAMRITVKNLLHQDMQKYAVPKDGMDLALCIIDKETNMLSFAGANIPLIVVRDGKENILDATHNPIGVYLREKEFTSQSFQLLHGDRLYLSSDGFSSQFGGVDNTKMKIFRFKEIIRENYLQPMKLQAEIFEKVFVNYMGDNPQVDDVLVIGLTF